MCRSRSTEINGTDKTAQGQPGWDKIAVAARHRGSTNRGGEAPHLSISLHLPSPVSPSSVSSHLFARDAKKKIKIKNQKPKNEK